MNNYADRELCQQIYDRKLILDAEMWWVKGLDGWIGNRKNEEIALNFRGTKPHKDFAICPAYNCIELLDALPDCIDQKFEFNHHKVITYNDYGNDHVISYDYWVGGKIAETFISLEDIEFVNVLAKMLIYLDDKRLKEVE